MPIVSRRSGFALTAAALLSVLGIPPASAEDIKIGLLKSAGSTAVYIAKEKGYFTEQGLNPELVFFEAAQPIAVAAVAEGIDVGSIGTSAGMFSLAAQGALKLIGGQSREFPGYQTLAVLVSNQAYAGGLKSFKDIGGRSVAVAQIGSGSHYSLTLIATKYGIDLNSIRVLPLQSISNQISAVSGGQADLTILAGSPSLAPVERGDLKRLGWIGDETPWQIGAIFVSTKVDNERQDMIVRFLRAFRKGAQEYHDAFGAPDDTRRDGPEAAGILAIMAKYMEQPAERLHKAIAYIDPQGRLDLVDMQKQIDWFVAQNLLKGTPKIENMIDKRVVIPLPAKK
jgi:NitT/TauT family transport system substrate-binding protein